MRLPVFSSCLLIILLTCIIAPAHATESASGNDSAGATSVEQVLAREVRNEIGRQYWVRGGTATNQVFCDAQGFPAGSCPGKRFGPQDSERFTIEAVNTGAPASREHAWFRVRFESGKTGYLNADTLQSQMFIEMRYQDAQPDRLRVIYELFFNQRPEEVIARVQQRSADRHLDALRREQQRIDKGSIRVGMTKQQVLNSSWGAPERIHAADIGVRRREQWVYGMGQLFFEDGTLIAIQTAR